MHSLTWLLLISSLGQLAAANTEIISLHLPLVNSAQLPPNLLLPTNSAQVLHSNDLETASLALDATSRAFRLYRLDTTLLNSKGSLSSRWSNLQRQWGLEAWTIRLCWPASHPTDFDLQLYTLGDASTVPQDVYLAVQATPSFVAFPTNAEVPPAVPYTLLLEPAYLGGVPASTIPLIGSLVGLLMLLWLTKLPSRVADVFEALGRSDGSSGRRSKRQ